MKNWQEELLNILRDKGFSEFRLSVYAQTFEIPAGQTVTYTQIAKKIGCPRAVRAVAGALAANPIPLIIPCHRVVRKDGRLGGYKWGEGLKKEILEMEHAFSGECG